MTHETFARQIIDLQPSLYRISTTILPQLCDREDAVQECIIKAWRSCHKLRDDGALRAWVIRILINECYATLRRRRRELPVDTLPEREAAPDADTDLYQMFTSLPEKYRLPLVLHYVEGYSVREIAQMTRLTQGAVKTRLRRGRLLLKDNMAAEEVHA